MQENKQQGWAQNRHSQSGLEFAFSGATVLSGAGMAQLRFLHMYRTWVSIANGSDLAVHIGYSGNTLKLIWQHRE